MHDLTIHTASFDKTIDGLLGHAVSGSGTVMDENSWSTFVSQCQSLEADLISTISLFLADRIVLSSTHLALFRDSFAEYLFFPMTAFVIVWFVLEHMVRKDNPSFVQGTLIIHEVYRIGYIDQCSRQGVV